MKKSVDFEGKAMFNIPSSIDVQLMEKRQNAYASNGRVAEVKETTSLQTVTQSSGKKKRRRDSWERK